MSGVPGASTRSLSASLGQYGAEAGQLPLLPQGSLQSQPSLPLSESHLQLLPPARASSKKPPVSDSRRNLGRMLGQVLGQVLKDKNFQLFRVRPHHPGTLNPKP